MHRRWLLDRLSTYTPQEPAESAAHQRIITFVEEHPDCFERALTCGHITGSAWLLDRAGARALLTYHRKLDMWLQLGGHADGHSNVLEVALREAREESGIDAIVPVTDRVFDVDVHPIPARGDEPRHLHYDVRFLLQVVDSDRFQVSDESWALKWISPDELVTLNVDKSVRRMCSKWVACGGASATGGPSRAV